MKWPKFRIIPFVMTFLVISLITVYTLRSRIMENKYAKAKMEIFETLLNEEPENQRARILEIIDSTLTKADSLSRE